jgi:hypothetical protein
MRDPIMDLTDSFDAQCRTTKRPNQHLCQSRWEQQDHLGHQIQGIRHRNLDMSNFHFRVWTWAVTASTWAVGEQTWAEPEPSLSLTYDKPERSLSSQEGLVWFPVWGQFVGFQPGYSCQLCLTTFQPSLLLRIQSTPFNLSSTLPANKLNVVSNKVRQNPC